MSTRPALLVVDDDAGVLRALESDVRRHVGDRFRVVRADGGRAALRVVEQLAEREEPLALVLSDQRMPEMTGIELLAEVARRAPRAKRVLLTAYADTDVAIRGINDVRLDQYLLKPWDPPEQSLYPTLDQQLGSWLAEWERPFEGVRVLSDRWSPAGHELRTFLARHQVPFRWLDVEHDAAAARLIAEHGGAQAAPVVLVGGERVLRAPSVESLAEALGLRTTAASDYYHVVICGGGPAGLAAAVYAASEGLRTLLIDRGTPGGQASQSSLIENYLGFPSGISGAELTRNALAQAKRFGSEVLSPCAASEVRAAGEYRRVVVGDREIATHAVVVATGVAWRTLDAPGLAALTGAGVYYGASRSEDEALRGEEVWIVGGANSAGQAALHFAGIAARVHMVIRATSLRDGMSTYLAERLEGIPNVVVHPEREVARAHGTDRLEGLTLRHVGRGNEEEVPVRSLFVFIGAEPDTAWLGDAYARDPHGFLLTGPEAAASGLWREKRPPATLETSVAGVFAAGDVRAHANRRVASAVGDGGMAVSLVHRHLRHLGAHP